MFRVIDLCCGVGGLRLGFEKHPEFTTVFSNDIDKHCKVTYDLNFNEPKLTLGDLHDINPQDIPPFDLLLAGYPCQPFSVAGKQLGFSDKRSNIFYDLMKIIATHTPQCVFLENVKNLQRHNSGKTFEVMKTMLEEQGYHVKFKVLNTKDYTKIPQNRERIFIVGFLDKEAHTKFTFPEQSNEPLLNYKGFLESEVHEKYEYNTKAIYDKIKDEIKSDEYIYQYRRPLSHFKSK